MTRNRRARNVESESAGKSKRWGCPGAASDSFRRSSVARLRKPGDERSSRGIAPPRSEYPEREGQLFQGSQDPLGKFRLPMKCRAGVRRIVILVIIRRNSDMRELWS